MSEMQRIVIYGQSDTFSLEVMNAVRGLLYEHVAKVALEGTGKLLEALDKIDTDSEATNDEKRTSRHETAEKVMQMVGFETVSPLMDGLLLRLASANGTGRVYRNPNEIVGLPKEFRIEGEFVPGFNDWLNRKPIETMVPLLAEEDLN